MSMRSKDVEIYVIKLRRLDVRRCALQQRIKKAVVIIILLGMTAALFGCAHSDQWTKTDTTMQLIVTAAYAADAYTTSKIQYDPTMQEEGLARHVLGRQPSTSDTYMYFGTLMLSNWLISRALPAQWRPFWQFTNFAAHGGAAIANCQQGAGCKKDET